MCGNSVISDMSRQKERSTKRSKKGNAKGSAAILKESIQLGCVSQDSYPRKSVQREQGKLGSKHAVIQKCAPHERSPCAPKFRDRSNEETLHQERCSRKAAWDLAKSIYKLKNSDTTTLCDPIEAKGMPALTSTRPEEREFVVDSEAPVHMMRCRKVW